MSIKVEEKVDCLICGVEVTYLKQAREVSCYYCGVEEEAYFCCEDGHYVCNQCHAQDALAIIKNTCLVTHAKDPIDIAERLMEHPQISMHGPEHHALVPAVLVTAYQNYVGQQDKKAITEAIKRGQEVPGGYCGLYGACGGGIGAGVAVSILLEATPLTADERSHANWMTAQALEAIADAGGARCCKKATRVALEEGVSYLSDLFDLNWVQELDLDVKCNYIQYNRECDLSCDYR
ncbi:DUF5714 domain-containing protein [Natroniella sulfidigena]|uniref:DUF5714 domain-containing protein n=1 Tax=Natroniella sulfidigena TaxID=723921 RepID=UPI00200ABA24|nr:DUF5714 domain-containing protein [Natroniella sulfidigena]MCK8818014.1 DUF5714 domain-containing protein [Natroniella sulfidigena]